MDISAAMQDFVAIQKTQDGGKAVTETLGELCDKLTVVKLKLFHTDDSQVVALLKAQEHQLREEITTYMHDVFSGKIPVEKLTKPSLKIYKKKGNEISAIKGDLGFVFSELATVNCRVWHEQEKVYDFEKIEPSEKNAVIKRLAVFNLQRNQCIEMIDSDVKKMVFKAKVASTPIDKTFIGD